MANEINPAAIGTEEKEAPATELAVVSDNTTYVHTFKEPFEWEGKTYDKLTFRFNSLRGRDILMIAQELRMQGVVLATRTFDVEYQYRYAARCCEPKIGSDILLALPAKDFDAICNATRRFLVSTER